MAWLSEPLGDQSDKTPLAPRCTKDLVNDRLFALRQNHFASLDLVFQDTTAIQFEGAGGEAIGQRGHSKDARTHLKQMVAGAVLDSSGRPILREL